MKPQHVWIEIDRPSDDGRDSGRVSQGYFLVEAGLLVMTNPAGVPIEIGGKTFEHVLAPDDDARRIAGRFTRQIYRLVNGDTGSRRKLEFPNVGIA